MAEKTLKEKTINGVMWSAVDRFSSQGIQFVFNILIARILLPEDYGVVAMLGIFMAIAQTFIDSGFGGALIRKKDRTEDDYNTVFYFNLAVSILFYVILFLAAPAIAKFYKIPLLTKITRVVSITLVINAFSAVQNTKLSIDLDFRKKSIINIISVTVVGAVGLILAARGLGVWALVFQSLFSSAFRTILLWAFGHWMPRLLFSVKSFKEFFSFGSKLLVSSLIDTLYNNIYTIVIGKCFSLASLGLYNKAESFAAFPSSSLTNMLQSVTFPVLSSIQDEKEKLLNWFRSFLRLSAYVIFPLMIGLAAVADPFVRIVLNENWAGMIYLLQIVCFALMWYPIHSINLNILLVKGRSDLTLKTAVIEKVAGVVVLCITIPMGLVAMCYGRIIHSIFCLYINARYSGKLIDYGFGKQLRDYMPIFVLSVVMGVIVWLTIHFIPSLWVKLAVGILEGVAVYLVGSVVFRFEELSQLVSLIKEKVK